MRIAGASDVEGHAVGNSLHGGKGMELGQKEIQFLRRVGPRQRVRRTEVVRQPREGVWAPS